MSTSDIESSPAQHYVPPHHLPLRPDYPPPTGEENDINYPSTWNTVYLPYHDEPRACKPSHLDFICTYIQFAGQGAKVLRQLIKEYSHQLETTEQRNDFALSAFLCWPFNVTPEGTWKEKNHMTTHEILYWKQLRMHQIVQLSERNEDDLDDDDLDEML